MSVEEKKKRKEREAGRTESARKKILAFIQERVSTRFFVFGLNEFPKENTKVTWYIILATFGKLTLHIHCIDS